MAPFLLPLCPVPGQFNSFLQPLETGDCSVHYCQITLLSFMLDPDTLTAYQTSPNWTPHRQSKFRVLKGKSTALFPDISSLLCYPSR